MNAYISWLDGSDGVPEAGVAGGKGASLARLAAAGFPVPPGFAVTAAAYRAFHDLHALDPLVAPLESLSGRPPMAQVREAVAPVAAALDSAHLPEDLRQAIAAAFADLASRTGESATFAVRSSGVSEDGAKASFAGLYESYINISGEDAILKAVRDCYECLWKPGAVHYRTMRSIGHRHEAMAAVVMQTVHSRTSGVAFTRHPVTGAEDQVLINASWGLGESIVAGLVTPDSFVTSKSGAILERETTRKEKRIVPVAGGTAEEDVPADQAGQPSLTEDEVGQVAEAAIAIETHYGMPMDIEFAFDHDGRFFLLQARPITTR